MVKDCIFELGCEELPSGAVWPLANELTRLVTAALDKAQLSYGKVKTFATPRRLAFTINDLQSEQASQLMTRRGPAALAAFDKEGKPTPALMGFAKSCGVKVEELSRVQTDKGEWMVYESEQAGSLTRQVVPEVIKQSLAQLSIAKPMRWGNADEEFARPIHWAVLLYGDEVLAENFLGVQSGQMSRGHRFHHPQEIEISSAQSYEQQLRDAYVLADFSQRKAQIEKQVNKLAADYEATAVMPPELLDEVTSIVEWPQALIANFEKEFLEVPAEALIASMQAHQKCFALKDKSNTLLPYFITVANIQSTNPNQVILGNEKVMRARLSDAAFFFKQDKKHPLSDAVLATKQVVFQEKLGSLHEKMLRVKQLMAYLSEAWKFPTTLAKRAAELSKCDLLSGMVGEFPELQGLMGYYYALNDGEDPKVARALDEQYMPRFAADNLPDSVLGKALSVADRIDTLVGIFAIGQKPTGVKDPFKLRRHALAVIRILSSMDNTLKLSDLIHESLAAYGATLTPAPQSLNELKSFVLDRLNAYYQNQDIGADLVHAVRARQDECFYDLNQRLNALKSFVMMPEASSLSAACKRVNNLLNHAGAVEVKEVDPKLLEEGAEQALFIHLNKLSESLTSLYVTADYSLILKQLAAIKEPVDAFFDNVMVLVENESIKNNRIALLVRLRDVLQGVADISLLH